MTISHSKPLATWDGRRQQAYRDQHPEQVFVFHLLLDASGSMQVHEMPLRVACNRYIAWLKRHGPAMSLVDMRAFGSTLQPQHVQPLGAVCPLSAETYSASYGGTALRDAIGTVCTQATDRAQHVLVVFTDGMDGDSQQWSEGQVQTLLTTLQDASGWLCLFLGAFQEALPVAAALGFKEGNSLTFASEKIADAFEQLRRATEGYLLASPRERKLLAQGGVFERSERCQP